MKQKLKKCRVCTNKIQKPTWLSVPRYKERKFCSRACYAKWMRTNKEGWWKNYDYRNRKLTSGDKDAIKALQEYGYFKNKKVLLPGDKV